MRPTIETQRFAPKFHEERGTYAAPHRFSFLLACLLFCFPAVFGGAIATGEAKFDDSQPGSAEKGGVFDDRGIVVCRGSGEDSADRDGVVTTGGKPAATDG